MTASQEVFCGQDISLVCPGNSWNCSYSLNLGVAAMCRVNDLRDLKKGIAMPDRVQSLYVNEILPPESLVLRLLNFKS